MTTTSPPTAATLTDRYLHAFVRVVPEAQRATIDAEVRERIADAIDARMADGEDAEAAERAVLTELGDPERLAATYLDRPLQLIGPRYYLTWWRLLKLLLVIVLPCVAGGLAIAGGVRGDGIGEIIGSVIGITITAGVHLAFWTTLAFAILDRATSRQERSPDGTSDQDLAGIRQITDPWTLDSLPSIEDSSVRLSRSETIASVVLGAAFIAFLVVQQFNPFLRDAAGAPIPLLDPSLWSWLLPYLIAITALSIGVTIASYLHGRANWWSATVLSILSIAFAGTGLWAWTNGELLNPAFWSIIPGWPDADWVRITGIAAGLVWAGIVVWDVIAEFFKASRAQRRRR